MFSYCENSPQMDLNPEHFSLEADGTSLTYSTHTADRYVKNI